MKRLFTIVVLVILNVGIWAQSPQKMSYQAVIRNNSNALVASSPVGMRLSILQGSPTGTEVYKEIYNPDPQTNANGLVTIEIGGGTPLTGTFSGIDWSAGPYFIKTETDPTGGTNYTISGTSQLLSVPYALYSNNAATVKTNADLTGDVASTGNATTIANKQTMTATAPVSITGSPNVIASAAVAISIAEATPNAAGSMSAADKTKLDGIAIPTHTIGESYGGGIIFWLDATGLHGLIANTTDQSSETPWYNNETYTNTTAFSSSVGGGEGNTSMIVFNQGEGFYAAKVCYDVTEGGSFDWYLPSKYELNLMYQNIGQGNLLGLGNVGGFANDTYWSSTEYNIYNAWEQNFSNGSQTNLDKSGTVYVRAIRAF